MMIHTTTVYGATGILASNTFIPAEIPEPITIPALRELGIDFINFFRF